VSENIIELSVISLRVCLFVSFYFFDFLRTGSMFLSECSSSGICGAVGQRQAACRATVTAKPRSDHAAGQPLP